MYVKSVRINRRSDMHHHIRGGPSSFRVDMMHPAVRGKGNAKFRGNTSSPKSRHAGYSHTYSSSYLHCRNGCVAVAKNLNNKLLPDPLSPIVAATKGHQRPLLNGEWTPVNNVGP